MSNNTSSPPVSSPQGRSIPVGVKLLVLAIGTTVLALLVACSAFVYYDRVSTAQSKESTLSVLAASVAQSAFGPTAFQDKESAATILGVLEEEPSAEVGVVYLQDGSQLAQWQRAGADVGAPKEAKDIAHKSGFHDGRLYTTTEIGNDSQDVGTLLVIFSARDLAERTARFLQIAAVVLLFSMAAAALVAFFAQKRLTRPVHILADAAHKVQELKDFDVRAERVSNDELGRLTDAFNDMLSMIQSRDRELELHRTQLEDLVAERTRDLDQRNAEMRLVLNNVDQGLLIVDREKRIGPERSAVVERWFGGPADEQGLSDFLDPSATGFAAQLDLGWSQLLEGFLPLELNLTQLPGELETPEGRSYEVAYRPIGGDEDTFEKLLVIVSDVTAQKDKERSEAEQAQIIAMLQHIHGDRNGFIDFFEETEGTIARLIDPAPRDRTLEMRELHTLKGNFGLFGMRLMAKLIHGIEDECIESGDHPTPAHRQAIREAWTRIADHAKTLLGDGAMSMTVSRKDVERIMAAIREGRTRDELSAMTLRLLLDPVEPKLARIGERARGLATRLGKGPIEIAIEAEDVRAPGDLAWLWHVLPHVVANSVDHGLDSPEERETSGKPGSPTLRLRAVETARSLTIEIEDNGRGVDWERVRSKAERSGLPSETEQDLMRALFSDGVSTKDAASEVSGRGIGLAAVKSACENHGANVFVQSEMGRGTTFRFTIANSNHTRPSLPLRRSIVA